MDIKMPDMDTLPLDFVADDTQVGFRLDVLEILNWGTFNRRVWRLELGGRNGLLTGDIGSGKSTLVDAVTTLLVPAHRVAYNKAAGAEARERSLRSYVLGHYKNAYNEGAGINKPVALRDHSSYSVILGVFRNQGYDQTVTLAQLFWFKEPEGQPERLYVVAERALGIADAFGGFGADLKALRSKLKGLGCELFDTFPPYGAWFCRRFGIKHEQALELFHQTVSMKSVGNLTEFVRNHMLEPFPVAERIAALIDHFDDLDQAHQAVLKAKRQVEQLTPLVADGERHAALTAEIESLNQDRDAVHVYLAGHKGALLEQRLAQLTEEAQRIEAESERLANARDQLRETLAQIEGALRDNGGDRLEQLAAEIRRKEREQAQRRQKADRYAELLRRIDAPPPADEPAFIALQHEIQARAEELRSRLAELDSRLSEDGYALRRGRETHAELSEALAALERRKSNIDAVQIRIRETLCAALGIAEETLPFAGELIQVRDDAQDWRGAAERLLRGFALSLLVPDTHYRAVADWVDRQHLGGRLVYFHVRPRPVHTLAQPHPQSLVRKLIIKPDTPYGAWLEQELRQRFDVVCCEDLEQFRREPRALTRAGQIKDPSGRHEKDDRHRLDDPSRYVLGWSNADKRRALHQQRSRLEEDLRALGERMAAAQAERMRLQEQLATLAKLEEFNQYAELDWQTIAREIAQLEDERRRLAAASDVLQTLNRQLIQTRARLQEIESALAQAQVERGVLKNKIDSAEESLAQTRALIASAPLDEAQIARLDGWRSAALGARPLTLESCAQAEHTLDQWLRNRIADKDRELKRLGERLVKAMAEFKEAFKAETFELDASLAALPEYGRMLDRLLRDDLPRFETRFKELLRVNAIHEIANFHAQLNRWRNEIKERVDQINRSLQEIDYNPGRYIQLRAQLNPDNDIREFQQALRACTQDALSDTEDDRYSEERFNQVKAIIDRLRGREGLLDLDRRWTAKVTDVRNWFVFSASERWRADDAEYEHYADTGGKSGGQKEKLAYTVLAASLAYQFGLEWGAVRSRTFRFVVIDEAFGRGSDESARYALDLFQRLHLQLLVVTPLQKIQVIEPYVATVGFVHNKDGCDSQLCCLSIEEYRAQKTARSPSQVRMHAS